MAGSVDGLPWARAFGRRCRARTDDGARCDLRPHGYEIDHALERGMDIPRWSTRWTDGSYLSQHDDPPLMDTEMGEG
jgi:hypothetical protein